MDSRAALGNTANLDAQRGVPHLHSDGDVALAGPVLPRIGDQFGDDEFGVDGFEVGRRNLAQVPTCGSRRCGVHRQLPGESDRHRAPSTTHHNKGVGRVVAVANQKGGVAKTTTAITVSAALVEAGKRVLLVDLDAQACATFSLGLDPEDLPDDTTDFLLGDAGDDQRQRDLRASLRITEDGVWLLPATLSLAQADVALANRPSRERLLAQALAPVRDEFDFVLIDCSPSLGLTTINALIAADDVIVPVKCETLSHRGLGQLMETIDEVQRWSNPRLRMAGIVPTLFDGRTAHAKAVLADLGPRFGVPVFEPIPRSIRFAEAPAVGRTILATAPSSPGARAYRALAEELAQALAA